jgi:hypothetical protein
MGIAGAFRLNRVTASLLFGVSPADVADDDWHRGGRSLSRRSSLLAACAARFRLGPNVV